MSGVIKLDKPALVLRTSDAEGRSYYDSSFQWPESGKVVAPDWNPSKGCGNGLHGLLWGQGDAGYLTFATDARWQVVEINEYVDVADTDGHPPKVKYPEGVVLFSGSREEATALIHSRAPNGTAVAAVTLTGGYGSTLTGGDDSTLTGGDDSTLTGGYGSTLTGGDDSTLTGGDDSTLTGGYGSTLTGGNRSTLTGGDDSTLTGGYGSTLTGGYGSTLTGGNRSTLTFKWWTGSRYRRRMVETGDAVDGIVVEAGKAYRITNSGVIVPA